VFYYFGNDFEPHISAGDVYFGTTGKVKIKGAFKSNSLVTVKYLREPFFIYARQQAFTDVNAKNEFKIEMQAGLPVVEFSTKDILGIEMKRSLD